MEPINSFTNPAEYSPEGLKFPVADNHPELFSHPDHDHSDYDQFGEHFHEHCNHEHAKVLTVIDEDGEEKPVGVEFDEESFWDCYEDFHPDVSTEEKEKIRLTAKDKLAVCEQCDKFLPTYRRCAECGCFMEIKARMPGLHCPLGKW